MDTPELSIILPVYNGEAFLDQAVESVLYSTLQNWELILVNDGSTDSTENLCKAYCLKDKRIHFISQDNRGLSAARNAGFSIACGTYVMYLDADDYVEPEYYDKVLTAVKETGTDFLVTGFTREFLHDREKKRIVPYQCPRRFLQSIEEIQQASQDPFFYNVYIHAWNKIYRREHLQRNQILFDESFRYGEDVPYNIRVLETSKTILFLDCIGYHYICRDRARLTTKWDSNLLDYNCQIYRQITDHEYGCWRITESSLAAGMYLRGCCLTTEKAIFSGLDRAKIQFIIKRILTMPETLESIKLCRKQPCLEFQIYHLLFKLKHTGIFFMAVRFRKRLKQVAGR